MDRLTHLVLKTFSENEELERNSDADIYRLIQDSIGLQDFSRIYNSLLRGSLIDYKNGHYLTELGKKRLKELELQIFEEEKDLKAERVKLHNQSILSVWQRRTFLPIFILGLFGGLYSAYDFISKIANSKAPKSEPVTIEQMELELSRLRTLILDQRSQDSLNHSSLKADSLSQ